VQFLLQFLLDSLVVQPGSVMVTPGTVRGEEEERRRTEIKEQGERGWGGG
jgi:hypothetical protein